MRTMSCFILAVSLALLAPVSAKADPCDPYKAQIEDLTNRYKTKIAKTRDFGSLTFVAGDCRMDLRELVFTCEQGTHCYAHCAFPKNVKQRFLSRMTAEQARALCGFGENLSIEPDAIDPVTRQVSSCPVTLGKDDFWYLRFEGKRVPGGACGAMKPPAGPPGDPKTSGGQDKGKSDARDDGTEAPKALLDVYFGTNDMRVADTGNKEGAGQKVAAYSGVGMAGMAAEAVQILGEIVADRASHKAFGLIQKKVTKLLGCGEDAPKLQDTCKLLASTRIQELAADPSLLVAALSADAVHLTVDAVFRKLPGLEPLFDLVGKQVVTILIESRGRISDVPAQEIIDGIASACREALEGKQWPKNERFMTSTVAVSALIQCRTENSVATCNVTQKVEKLAEALKKAEFEENPETIDWPELKSRARVITRHLISATHAIGNMGKDPTRIRLHHALKALFAVLSDAISPPLTSCEKEKHAFAKRCVDLLEQASIAALDGDGGAFASSAFDLFSEVVLHELDKARADELEKLDVKICESSKLVFDRRKGCKEKKVTGKDCTDGLAALEADLSDLRAKRAQVEAGGVAGAQEKSKKYKKAFRFLSAIVRYRNTYSEQKTPEEGYAARKAILESLTREMTDRTGREGDKIWSLGGSLGILGGVRIAEKVTLAEPLSLALGIGFDRVPADADGYGVHLELTALDLGGYLSWKTFTDEEVKIEKPDWYDIIHPGFFAGMSWGTDLPGIFGLRVCYSPFAELVKPKTEGEEDRFRGSFYLGLEVGIYVPLLDLN